MKKFNKIILTVIITFVMICLVSCDIPNFSGSTNLQLLRIDTLDNTLMSVNAESKPTKLRTRVYKLGVEELNVNNVTLVAVIKNEDRASFIDMVVYNSQTTKTVVYNEGNRDSINRIK